MQPHGLDDHPRCRHGAPGGAAQWRHRPRALPGLRLRDGHGPDHDAALRHPRHPRVHAERPALPGVVLMRVPLSWLREYVDFDLEPEALAEKLTLLGMEVKSVTRIGADWHNVIVGELLEVGPHPNSTKLQLTKVRVGASHPILSIVCGAHNIAAGQHVPVALPGAVLPGDRRIEVTRIAGEESQGMLCSGDELRVDTDADGILILDPD